MDPLAPLSVTPRPIAPIAPPGPAPSSAGSGFVSLLKDAVAELARTQKEAEAATTAFATGRTTDVASTMIAVERASITFQLMLQVRNRLLEAYQEIQQLQV